MWHLVLRLLCRWIPSVGRAVGREHFQVFLHEELPEHVEIVGIDLETRVTRFAFEAPFDRYRLILNRFDDEGIRFWFLHRVLIGDHMAGATGGFSRSIYTDEMVATVWLYLDDDAGRGAFIVMP